jgi:hypothetical protein
MTPAAVTDAVPAPPSTAELLAARNAVSPSSTTVPTFQQAVTAALAEHSPSDDESDDDGEQAEGTDESTDDDTDTDDGDEEAPPAQEDDKAPSAPAAKAETTSLISDADLRALQTKYANQPDKLLKEYNRVFTQKLQDVAQQRKAGERAISAHERYGSFIEAYETDPDYTVGELARRHGYTLVKADGTPAAGGTGATTSTKTDDPVAVALADLSPDKLLPRVTELLEGSDVEYMAEPFTRVFSAVLEPLTKAVRAQTAAEVAPLREAHAVNQKRAAVEEAKGVLTAWGAKHPGWEDHRTTMETLADEIQMKPGSDENAYLDRLYHLATREAWEKDRDGQIARAANGAVDKMVKQGAGGSKKARRSTAVPSDQVEEAGPADRAPSFREAADAAVRGVRFR